MTDHALTAATDAIDSAAMHLLASARMVLDRVAQGHDERLAADALANRIVDVIGHSVTDEPPRLLLSAEDMLRYAERHRLSQSGCKSCPEGKCFEEWSILRDDLRNLIEAWGVDRG